MVKKIVKKVVEEQKNNIINFPNPSLKRRKKIINQHLRINENQILNRTELLRGYHINDTVNTLIPILFNQIELAGFELNPQEEDSNVNIKDGTLIIEAVRSLLCKHYGIFHPFQILVEKMIKINEENGFELVNNLKVNLKIPDDYYNMDTNPELVALEELDEEEGDE